MSTIHQFRTAVAAVVTVLTVALSAPMVVHGQDDTITAEEPVLAAAPAAPSWDETSGYGSVEAVRAAAALRAPVAAPTWDETSGYGAVEAVRATIGHDDLVSGYGTTGHEASAANILSWDETSGYGAVEANRAAASRVAPGDVAAALAAGTRAESAHLATVPLPGQCD